ncbi:fibrillin-1-like [Mercenaria mercenaria]|uniref:fibrillin-1-like n=1 Tax=Mercenaria mercenaria TaxID=6596 RepID=UPI00234F16CD|nr:fibrillin-1-like [Mercenaria mercenaria]
MKGWTGTDCSEDIDECEENVTLCQSKLNSTCENTNGSYNCRCNDGLRDQGNICTDCDIWKYGQDCQLNCTCNISNSEYCNPVTGDCKCLPEWNGTDCEDDVNECEEEDICPIHSSCENLFGAFECRCNKGYARTESRKCQDIDECTENKSGCEQNCSNTIGSYICSCDTGFKLSADGISCEACDMWSYGFSCASNCTCLPENTDKCDATSGLCLCKTGWNGTKCESDINECETETVCPDNSICKNSNGSFECICKDGFNVTDLGECKDIDECIENTDACSQNCTNTIGSFECSCEVGYFLEDDNVTCQDIDECIENTDACSQNCTNTIGSFECSCEIGYFLANDNVTCQDIDECVERDDTCSQYCTNTNGSFACTCAVGYYLQDDNITCQECKEWTFGDNCQFSCSCNKTNTDTCNSSTGQCECLNGWNGTACADDTNECENTTVCPQNSTCYNSDGSYECVCYNGFRLMDARNCEVCPKGTFGRNCSEECKCKQHNTESCNHVEGNCICKKGWKGISCSEDIDECEENSTLCQSKANSICENTNGSYSCRCKEGLREQGNICTDIDECTESPCTQNCTNTVGSFVCSCFDGYQLQEDNVTCDECTDDTYGVNCTDRCNCNVKHSANEIQTCDTVTGTCNCKSNWKGDTCDEDVNECDDDDTLCNDDEHTTCVNTEGWYECECKRGFVKTNEDKCVADISTTTIKPDSAILIEAVVVIEMDLPAETNLNAASVYIDVEFKLIATLSAFFRRFTNALVEIIITDIR